VVKLRLALPLAAAAALVAASSAAAFNPGNAYYAKQWYLDYDRAFDAWPTPPAFQQPVKVGVIDSGVDCSTPDLKGQLAGEKSFVGGSPCIDTEGHGTIVAGEIAGALNSGGVVGLAYSSQLLVAKVVANDGTIPLKAEAAGIVWAVNQGARVINLSFGAVRDPDAPNLDTYSKVEAHAVAYAVSKGAVVVAAVGNADEAYATPWPYASWPSALPHVIGVGALTRSGNVPSFSDQDPTYLDLAAPGVDIFSTFPKLLTNKQQNCTPQGYTDCASGDYRRPEGTSFAAPQVSAAAAVLLGLNPALSRSQVAVLLDRHADDVNAASGCLLCPVGRDKYSGWGRLDVAKAVGALTSGAPLPTSDHFEPNDDVGQAAHKLWGRTPAVAATIGYWDDPVDIYRVRLSHGQRLQARMQASWTHAAVGVTLWRPGTKTVLKGRRAKWRVAQSAHAGRTGALTYRTRKGGWYYVELKVAKPGAGRYSLRLTKSG
jgi:subtilisin family serine protease